MEAGIGMLFWLVIGAISTVYAIIFAINAWSPFHAHPGRRPINRRFWIWLSRRQPRSCLALAILGLLISSTCFSTAVQSYQNRQTATPPRQTAGPAPQAQRPSLVDQMVKDHQQAVAYGRVSQWQDQLITVGPQAVDLVLPLLTQTSDLRLKSDVLFCLQEATRVDLAIGRGQRLTPGQIDAAVRSLKAAQR